MKKLTVTLQITFAELQLLQLQQIILTLQKAYSQLFTVHRRQAG